MKKFNDLSSRTEHPAYTLTSNKKLIINLNYIILMSGELHINFKFNCYIRLVYSVGESNSQMSDLANKFIFCDVQRTSYDALSLDLFLGAVVNGKFEQG